MKGRKNGETAMRILLVEDDIEISRMLRDYLSVENYEVVCAGDGEAARVRFEYPRRIRTRIRLWD